MTEIVPQNPVSSTPLISRRSDPLTGRFATPGDMTIAQLALVLAGLTVGQTSIEGLPERDEVLSLAAALRQLGVHIEQHEGAWQIHGLGVGGLLAPRAPLDPGSDTGLSLLMGLLAPYDFTTRFTPSGLSMPSLLDALKSLGAMVEDDGEGLLTLRGSLMPVPRRHVMAAPSAPIKWSLLLAGLQIAGTTTIVEPEATSSHTENMLTEFGCSLTVSTDETGPVTITVPGLSELRPRQVTIPGDPSLAGYAVVAALIVPGSDLIVENVLVSLGRTGLIDTLLEMGGDIAFINQHEAGGEHIADLRIRSSRLKGTRVHAAHAATMLDDIAVLAIAAACAQGETRIEGLAALRHGRCDRLAAMAAGLAANRVTVAEGEESLTIGGIGKVEGGGTVASRGDADVAVSFLVLGLASQKSVTVEDAGPLARRFPGFIEAMAAIGGHFEPLKER